MTGLIEAGDLAWMQALQGAALPGSAILQRATMTPDGMGGYSESWAAVGTVAARVYTQASRALAEGEQGAQIVSETRWFVTLPVGTQVTAADRILAGGRLYQVTEVNNGQDWQTAVRCSVTKLDEGAE